MNVLEESFYKERDKEGQFNSLNFVERYLAKHKIEGILSKHLDGIFQNNLLPENPYCALFRGVLLEVIGENNKRYFEIKTAKPVLNRITNSQNLVGALEVDSNKVYGLTPLLEAINRKTLSDIIRYFQKEINQLKKIASPNSLVEKIIACFAGTQLFRSDFFECPQSHNKSIHLVYYVVCEGKPETVVSGFSRLVYQQCINLINASNKNMFLELRISITSNIQLTPDTVWGRSDVLLYRIKLLNELQKQIVKNYEITIQMLEEFNGRFRIVTRQYILICKFLKKSKMEYESFEGYPFSGVFRGVFTSMDDLEAYSGFYVDNLKADMTEVRQSYTKQQIQRLFKTLSNQKFPDIFWELYYFSLFQENRNVQENFNERIYDALAGELSEIQYINFELEIILLRLQNHIYSSEADIQIAYERIFVRVKGLFEKGRNLDMQCCKDMVNSLLNFAVENVKENKLRVRQVTRKLISIFQMILLNNYQLVLVLGKEMLEFLKKLPQKSQFPLKEYSIPCYTNLKKLDAEFVVIPEQSLRLKKLLGLRSEKDAADVVFTQYLKEYNFIVLLHKFFQELMFSPKSNNPLTNLLTFLNQNAFYIQYSQSDIISLDDFINKEQIQEVGLNGGIVVQIMNFQGSPLLFTYKQLMRFISSEEIKKVRTLIEMFTLDRNQLKIPGNCELNEIYSVSGVHLLQSSSYISQPLPGFGIDMDLVFQGGSQRQAEILFYEIVMQKCRKIQKQRNCGIVGFYSHNHYEQILKFYEPKVPLTYEEFKQMLQGTQTVFLKVILRFQDKVKILNYRLNFHLIRNDAEIFHLKEISQYMQFNRVFFKRNDLILWTKLYGIRGEPDFSDCDYFEAFDLGFAMKKFLLSMLKNKQEYQSQTISSVVQILYHYSQKMYYLAREALTYYFMIQYMKKDRTGKFEIQNVKIGFTMMLSRIQNILSDYLYIYNEGLSVSLIYFSELIGDYLQQHKETNGKQNELIYLQDLLLKISEMLEYDSMSMYMSFRLMMQKMKPEINLFF